MGEFVWSWGMQVLYYRYVAQCVSEGVARGGVKVLSYCV